MMILMGGNRVLGNEGIASEKTVTSQVSFPTLYSL